MKTQLEKTRRGRKFEKTLADRTPEERREIGRKGGIASGIARRENKRIAELIDKAFERMTTCDKEEMTMKEAAVLKAVKQAAKGNLEALALLAKLNGESKETLQLQALPPIQMTAFGFDDDEQK